MKYIVGQDMSLSSVCFVFAIFAQAKRNDATPNERSFVLSCMWQSNLPPVL